MLCQTDVGLLCPWLVSESGAMAVGKMQDLHVGY